MKYFVVKQGKKPYLLYEMGYISYVYNLKKSIKKSYECKLRSQCETESQITGAWGRQVKEIFEPEFQRILFKSILDKV